MVLTKLSAKRHLGPGVLMFKELLLVALAVAGFASSADAQARQRPDIADSSAVKIMAAAGKHVTADWMRDVLRRAGARATVAKADEIADSLVGRALSLSDDQSPTDKRSMPIEAVNALVLAGSAAPFSGNPYPGALDRLLRIFRESPSREVRSRSLSALLCLPFHARAVEQLKTVAESNEPLAYDAVQYLITDANGGSWLGLTPSASNRRASATALRSLALGGKVRDQRASNLLELWIQR